MRPFLISLWLLLTTAAAFAAGVTRGDHDGTNENSYHEHVGTPIDPDELRRASQEIQRDDPGARVAPPNGTDDPILNSDLQDQMGAMMEGDIQMTPQLMQRNAIRYESQKWPDGVVPYVIDYSFSDYERGFIAHAFEIYHERTCVRFVPRSRGQYNYIHIMKGVGCSSSVGMVGGRQDVSLGQGCIYVGIILHELMHAVGFMHEQSRADRDSYVTIDFTNIAQGNHYNFRRYGQNEVDDLGTTYDCNSVMHYNAYAFALDTRRPTIYLNDQSSNCQLGQREMFSQTDIDKINILYHCNRGSNGYTRPDVERPDLEQSNCNDGHNRCAEWAEKNQCRENPDWMLPNCPYSCGSCNQLCLDYNPRCEEWANRGECDANAAYMSSYCRRSCLQCDELSSPASDNAVAVDAVCADAVTIDKCGYWAENGRCTDENKSFKRYMEINCRKTCGFCSLP